MLHGSRRLNDVGAHAQVEFFPLALLLGDARIRIPASPFNSTRFQFASRLSEARLETKYT
jgi:hypothetical protein